MAKQFRPTYLYVKTHNRTGLKYFGKATGKDPSTSGYMGSGVYWRKHLEIHGNDVTTEIIGYFTVEEECVKTALEFSKVNDIVNANVNGKKIWANQIVENGIDGGATWFGPRSEEYKRKISDSQKGRLVSPESIQKCKDTKAAKTYPSRKGRTVSEETKVKIREARKHQKTSNETRAKMSASLQGHLVSDETRKKISAGHRGKVVSEETKEKLKNRIISEETKEKIRIARKNQKFSNETKQKLSGKVCVVDRQGKTSKIPKEEFYVQVGPKESWEFVSHRSTEGINRIKNAVPVFSEEEIVDISHMRR